jgi:hypothetical protein
LWGKHLSQDKTYLVRMSFSSRLNDISYYKMLFHEQLFTRVLLDNGRLISFCAANRMIKWLSFLNHVKEETTITVLFSSHMITTILTVNANVILASYLVI